MTTREDDELINVGRDAEDIPSKKKPFPIDNLSGITFNLESFTPEWVESLLTEETKTYLKTLHPSLVASYLLEAFVHTQITEMYELRHFTPGSYEFNEYRIDVGNSGEISVYAVANPSDSFKLSGLYVDPNTNNLILLQVRPKVPPDVVPPKLFRSQECATAVNFFGKMFPNVPVDHYIGLIVSPTKNKPFQVRYPGGAIDHWTIRSPITTLELNYAAQQFIDYLHNKTPTFSLVEPIYIDQLESVNNKYILPEIRDLYRLRFPKESLDIFAIKTTIESSLKNIQNLDIETIRGSIGEILAINILKKYFNLVDFFQESLPSIKPYSLRINSAGAITLINGTGNELLEIDGLLRDPVHNRLIIVETKIDKASAKFGKSMNEKRVKLIFWLLKTLSPETPESNYIWLNVASSNKTPEQKTVHINDTSISSNTLKLPYTLEELTELALQVKNMR